VALAEAAALVFWAAAAGNARSNAHAAPARLNIVTLFMI
jgi:hypothetical protein